MSTITRPDYVVLTINDGVPYDRFPTYRDGGPGTVTLGEWGVSYSSLCGFMSSRSVAAADNGKTTLKAYKVVPCADGPDRVERHPLHGTQYDSDEDAQRAAYGAGLLGFMVYDRARAQWGMGPRTA